MIVVLDVFESVLANFHFSSTVYCTYCSNRAPWGAAIDCSRNVQFHAVRSGKCWIRVKGETAVELQNGDLVVLAQWVNATHG